MEILRSVVIFVHLIGFAVTFGALVSQAVSREFRFTRVMEWGVVISFVTGLALAAPWPEGIELNYPKIGIKLVILLALGAILGIGSARQKRTGEPVPQPLFWTAGALSLLAAGLAVIW